MELKKMTIDGKEVEFVNVYRNTRSGFAHDTTMFINGRQYEQATCTYYNRTWECYAYQTVMQKAVRQMVDSRKEYLKDKFKRENNYSKLTSKRQSELDDIIKTDEEVIFADKILNQLNNCWR